MSDLMSNFAIQMMPEVIHTYEASTHEYFPDGSIFHGFVPLVMGTKLDVLMIGAEPGCSVNLWRRMCAEAERLDKLLSRFDPGSEVSGINCGEIGQPSGELGEIIGLCDAFRKSTGGLFDIRVAGFLDFGGFGKGFLLKKFKKMLLEEGIATAYLDFGGSSITALGHHPYGDCWKIAVTDPFTGAKVREIKLLDISMSTSGNQPGYSGHIINPRTGKPETSHRMVTVLSPDPLTAEVCSTAAMIADEKELDFIRKNNELTEIFVQQS